MIDVLDKKFELFITEAEIAARVTELSEQISREIRDKNPVFLAVLNGAFYFAADLLRNLKFGYELSFVKIASYQGMQSGPVHKTLLGLDENLEGRTVVILEDIVDSGRTIHLLTRELRNIPVADLKIAALIRKPNALQYPVTVDYCGYEAGDEFLVGYGLDYNKAGRQYRDIYKLVNH